MKKNLEQWSLVILGRWNKAILSPQWLAEEVFKEKDITILFPMFGGGPPVFQVGDIRIIVSNESVAFMPLKDSGEVLTRIEMAGRHILQTLPHTPIIAFGENFHYKVEGRPKPLADILDCPDEEQLAGYGKIGEVSLVRTIELPNCQLNLKIISDGSCRIELNYHYPVAATKSGATEAATRMAGTYVNNRAQGLTLLETVYHLTLDEDAYNDDNPT